MSIEPVRRATMNFSGQGKSYLLYALKAAFRIGNLSHECKCFTFSAWLLYVSHYIDIFTVAI